MQSLQEEQLQIVKSLITAFATGDWRCIRAMLTDDVLLHFPGRNRFSGDYRGLEDTVALWARIWRWTGGSARVRLHDALANDQHGVVMYTVTAARGDSAIAYQYFDVYHFRDGRISEVRGHADDQAAFDAFYSDPLS